MSLDRLAFVTIECPFCQADAIAIHDGCQSVIDWKEGESLQDAMNRHVCEVP